MKKANTIKCYFSVFLFFWCFFSLSNCGFDYSEGNYHYQLAEHILKTGRLGFDTPQSGIFTVAPNGKTYASHEIGNTLFFLPTALVSIFLENILSSWVDPRSISILQDFIRSFQPSFYSAITLTSFFGILRIGFNQKLIPGFMATLCLGITTYFWTYTRESYDGVLCGTLLVTSFLFLLLHKEKNDGLSLIISFVCLGFAFITRISMLLAIVASISYLVTISKSSVVSRLSNITTALVALLPFFLWQFWYNFLRTGFFYLSPVQTDEKYIASNTLDGNSLLGLAGLLFSPGKSIFVYAPLLILSVFFARKFYKENRKESVYILVLSIAWFFLHARLRSWYGAWGWGPRHLLPILPILFLPFAVNIEYVFTKISLKITTVVLAVSGFTLALSSIISSWYWRIKLAQGRDLLNDDIFIWSFWHSQPIDMLRGALWNLSNSYNIITDSPKIKTQNLWYLASGIKEYGSFTVNLWPNNLIFVGCPWYLVIFLVFILLFILYLSLQNILKLE